MRVAHGGVGDENAGARLHPGCKPLRSQPFKQLARAGRRLGVEPRSLGHARIGSRLRPASGVGMTVDGDIGHPGQEPRRPVLALAQIEQRRRLVDEARGVVVVAEFGMRDYVVQE